MFEPSRRPMHAVAFDGSGSQRQACNTPQNGPETAWQRQFWFRGANPQSAASRGDGAHATRRSPKLARLEAVLMIAEGALAPRKLAQLATLADATEARTLVNRLNEAYDRCGTPFRVERVAVGFQLFTRPEYSLWLGKLHQRQSELKLSPPALETLTVVAYRQPITRADIEAIRGVQSSEMLKQLMDRGLVRIAGEDDSLGRPFLYETTRKFLETFGLRDYDDLPQAQKLRKRPTAATPAPADATSDLKDATSSPMSQDDQQQPRAAS